jgi:DNA-binding GntR family transcriptional regulator
MTREIRRIRPSDGVQRILRRMILTGQSETGKTSQEQLAGLLGASATPERDALLGLEAEGFVERSPNQSVRVLEMTPEDLADIYETHAYLMGALARRACAKASPELVARLRACVTRSGEIGCRCPRRSASSKISTGSSTRSSMLAQGAQRCCSC